MEDSIFWEILKEMQKKYLCMSEIERITREIGEFLSRNDQLSVQMLLGMRQDEMDKADMFDNNIRCLMSVLTSEEAIQVEKWVKGKEDLKISDKVAENIIEKGKNIQQILKRTIETDKYINTRIAGIHSFYK